MARSRNIKPGLCKNEDLAECSIWARYLFACLPMWADREGRLEDRPARLKMEIFPADNVSVEPLLQELASHGTPVFIVRYQNSGGRFIQITRFTEHQSPHYSEKPSIIKPPALPESEWHKEHKTPRVLLEDSGKSTGIKRGSQPPDSLIPDSLIPDSLIPDSLIPDSGLPQASPSATPRRRKRADGAPPKSAETFNAYSSAYRERYGVDPVRNAKVSAQLCQLVQRLGTTEAPAVAAFYVQHSGMLYVRGKHPVDLLVRDAEGLRTEWVTGRKVTDTEARQADRTQATGNAFAPLIAEAERREVDANQ